MPEQTAHTHPAYTYDRVDHAFVAERVAQFRDQVRRRLDGQLSEEEFRPLRLQNGLYYQRHAYMLRVAIPYGTFSADQLRMFAHLARTYDRGYGHFTTRQNLQYNWLALEAVPDILAELATVQMHAIQTSGNCVRNVTADHLAGVAADELFDPRPYCELMRQYSTVQPEFLFLPRKFKIAFSGAAQDRAALLTHDLAFRGTLDAAGNHGFAVIVGGGLGRSPILGQVMRGFLAPRDLLSYTEAILRVYNLHGNRKSSLKARIKILVKKLGVEAFTQQVEEEWGRVKGRGGYGLSEHDIARMSGHFALPELDPLAATDRSHEAHAEQVPAFATWLANAVQPHKAPGYHIVHVTLKGPGRPPGDVTADEMDAIATLAERHSFGELRATHEQNLILPHVANADLFAVWSGLAGLGLAQPVRGTLNDIICCPGLDFCSLANATSIPLAKALYEKFDDVDTLHGLGEIKLKMSGCINACAHHHVGHIGILGIDKRGENFYQIMLGGSAEDDASLGQWIGKAIALAEVPDAVERMLEVYVARREPGERLLDTTRRIGVDPFRAAVYGPSAVPVAG